MEKQGGIFILKKNILVETKIPIPVGFSERCRIWYDTLPTIATKKEEVFSLGAPLNDFYRIHLMRK
jgi:hypothetical protein